MSVKAHRGVISIIDDISMFILSHRYKALHVFKHFLAEIETKLE